MPKTPKKPTTPLHRKKRDRDPSSNPEKLFRIRVYANTGISYSGDIDVIADFVKEFKSVVDYRGQVIVDNEDALIDFIIDIGQNGFLREGTQGYVFFPPHRIHYVEAIDQETK
jgi:hypothetical protein